MAPHGEQVLIDCTTTFLLSIPPSLKKLWLLSYRFASQVFTNPCPPATSGDGWSTSPPSGTIILRLYENYGESSDRWAPVIDPPWERLSGTLKARGWRTPPTSQDSMRSHLLLVSPVDPRTLAEIGRSMPMDFLPTLCWRYWCSFCATGQSGPTASTGSSTFSVHVSSTAVPSCALPTGLGRGY